MTVELQPILNSVFGAGLTVCAWFFAKSQDHERRIQKIEDLHSAGIDDLKNDLEKLETKFDTMNETLNNLKTNVHRQNNTDNNLNTAINLLIKKLDNETN